jgi:CubicO group peptidase (beta-lactamase class C family)
MEQLIDDLARRRPLVGLAAGIVSNGRFDFHGHGVADIDSGEPISERTVFRIASITKTFTAIAIMQLWQEGLVDLDSPANDYLSSYELTPAKPDISSPTVRHLLTHTGGIGELARPSGLIRPDFGESVKAGDPLPSLAEFYRHSIAIHAEPGTRYIYNNHGPSTLGQLVEDVTGKPLHRYFQEHVFEPLGMSDTTLLRSTQVQSRLATGHEITSAGVKKIVERDMVTAGAASIYSTPADMARYMSALLGGGSNDHGTVLRPDTLELMFQPHYQPDPRVPGMGLGFFRSRYGRHSFVGHQGTHPGFHSQMLLAPEHATAVIMHTNGAHQPDLWLPFETAALLEKAAGIDSTTSPAPERPQLWENLCGWYKLSARATDIRLRSIMGAGVEVFVRRGILNLRFLTPIPELYKGFPLLPDDPQDGFAYRIKLSDSELESIRILFGRDGNGRVNNMCLDLMPVVLDKQRESNNPRRWMTGTLGAIGALAATRKIRRRRK